MDSNANCPCKRVKCPRHGDCAACREHHSGLKVKSLPACQRLKEKEERRAGRRTER